MKGLYTLLIVVFTTAPDLSAQILSRYTTTELLNRTKADNNGFNPGYPEEQIDDALPLIDSAVAVELAKLSGSFPYSRFTYAITLQCPDDSLKQIALTHLLEYDKLCNGAVMTKNNYDKPDVSTVYQYGRLKNALLAQTQKNDSELLKTAIKEFEFWGPFASDYIHIVLKPGMHQLSMGKREFNPCVLASVENCSLWIACIYMITGKEDYGSSNEQLNEVYWKFIRLWRIDKQADNRKDLIRFGKDNTITTSTAIKSLDSLDFDSIPELKEKFDNVRKKDDGKIIIYTHDKKALLYLDYTEMVRMGLSKQVMSSSILYLVELNSPTTIRLTKINYRDRYN